MKKDCGFTLLELIVVMAIGAILTVLAVPPMITALQDNRLTTQMNQIAGLLTYARKEAVSRRTTVSACATSNGAACNTVNWEAGILIFVGDAATTPTPAAADTLKVIGDLSDQITIRRQSNTDVVPAGFNNGYLRFSGSGMIESSDAGSFKACDDRGATEGRGLIINGIGQIRGATDSDNDGTVEIIFKNLLTALTDTEATCF
ncbi:GspH/FimT family pseudopilin [Sedimenticola sp.]|uniref:GspH/FimT family pseudopilin n=1 Tax=Sedimenticola sp. TaxID=1940285 RepID=UPI003D11925D